jgi:murein DD-endopeptidase MepM/ murein hydrolase activator NlpD
VFQAEISGPSVEIPSGILVHGRTYYWMVQAVGPVNLRSRWSSPAHFTVGTDAFTWPTDPANSDSGEMRECPDDICYVLSSGGWRDAQPFLRAPNAEAGGKYHLGADWNLGSGSDDRGRPVHAVADGIVTDVQRRGDSWGVVVFILHHTPWGTVTSMYAHLSESAHLPAKDSVLRIGTSIGRIGDGNGFYRGREHLHFEIRVGNSTLVGTGYIAVRNDRWCADRWPVSRFTSACPQGQLDPDAFIDNRRGRVRDTPDGSGMAFGRTRSGTGVGPTRVKGGST